VEELLAEVLVPEVVMRVQLHQGQWAMHGSERAELGEEDGVIAS
jgi:hypothetical protein